MPPRCDAPALALVYKPTAAAAAAPPLLHACRRNRAQGGESGNGGNGVRVLTTLHLWFYCVMVMLMQVCCLWALRTWMRFTTGHGREFWL